MFKARAPVEALGGRAGLLSPLGPLGDFFKRLQLSHMFDMISADLAVEFNRLREARNKVSHSWDAEVIGEFFLRGKLAEMFPVEAIMAEREDWGQILPSLNPLQVFRIRVIWLLGRLAYEAPLYARIRDAQLPPGNVLYGDLKPERLGQIMNVVGSAGSLVVRAKKREAGHQSHPS